MNSSNRETAVFPGSFDPFTNGHIDLVKRACRTFDRVTIAILDNLDKNPLFTADERVEIISEIYADQHNIQVQKFAGLLVDFVKSVDSQVIIRGLRAISDYDYEAQMALMNRTLDPDVETFFLTSSEQNSYISSTLVKQVAKLKGDVSKLVHPIVVKALKSKLS